jgi:SAM-dependent methyltransferase
MESKTSSVLVSEPESTAKSGELSRGSAPESCPICGCTGAREWLRAPDRFHGRRDEYTLLRCPDCAVVWLSKPPKPSEMHLHYTDAYDRLISAAGENSPGRWRARNTALSQYKQSGSLLDLGCSSGAFLQTLTGKNWDLHGIEMSEESASKARKKTGAKIFVGDILDAQFQPETFDVITCFDVFEHLYEPRRVMKKVAEWLKPGGVFYVLVPNVDSAEGRVFGSYWHGLELPRHLFHYSPSALKNLADSVGLSSLSVETRRNAAIDTSLRYVWEKMLRSMRIQITPVAYRRQPNLPWRAARKLTRMTLFRFLQAIAPIAGEGESIHAVFQKGGEKS